MSTAHLYIRLGRGHTEEGQKEKLCAYAVQHYPEHHLQVYVDSSISGKLPMFERIAGNQVMLSVRPGDVVLVTEVSRAWLTMRDMFNCCDNWMLREIEVCILGLHALSVKELVIMAGAFRTVAAQQKGDRAKELDDFYKGEGIPHWNHWGLKRKKLRRGIRWDYNHRDRAIAQHILDLRESGMSWHKIWKVLLRERVRTSKGKELSQPAQVRDWAIAELGLRECERVALSIPEGRDVVKERKPVQNLNNWGRA